MSNQEFKEYLKRKNAGKVTLKDYDFNDWLLYNIEHNRKFQFVIKIVIPVIASVITTLIVLKIILLQKGD